MSACMDDSLLCSCVCASPDAEDAGEKSDPYCQRTCTPASADAETLPPLKVHSVKFEGSPTDNNVFRPLSSMMLDAS